MSDKAEIKRLEAIARANEVFDAMTRIGHLRAIIQGRMLTHDAKVSHNKERRDCAAFHERISELGLRQALIQEFEA